MDSEPAHAEAEATPTASDAGQSAVPARRRVRRRRARGGPVPTRQAVGLAQVRGGTADTASSPSGQAATERAATHLAEPTAQPERSTEAGAEDGVGHLTADGPADHASPRPEVAEDGPPLPALQLRDGLPPLVDTPEALAAAVLAIRGGTGPVAIDTERASGYRYGQRAYLIQLRRAGSGTHLIDPIAVPGVPGLAEVLTGPEWVLHAASQDLPCLLELELRPSALFDTELAGRLLGMPRVGLAPMVAEILGHALAKGHGAADWSRRPLPDDWLEYAALDVEVLLELRDELTSRLTAAGKLGWAQEEFEALRTAAPAQPRTDPWRRTAGIHQVRSPRGLALVEHLWYARDEIARQVDVAPGRLLPDSSIVAAARALPQDPAALRALRSFHGRGAARYQREWSHALATAWAVPEPDLPTAAPRTEGAPPARVWRQRDPEAAARLDRARRALARRAEQLALPVENLVTPDLVRRLMWDPSTAVGDDPSAPDVAAFLLARGARQWQVTQVAQLLAGAIPPAAEAAAGADQESPGPAGP